MGLSRMNSRHIALTCAPRVRQLRNSVREYAGRRADPPSSFVSKGHDRKADRAPATPNALDSRTIGLVFRVAAAVRFGACLP